MTLLLKSCKEDAEAILNHEAIYPTICDDRSPEKLFILDSWTNVVVYMDGPVACFVLHPHNTTTMECHVQVLPEFRHLSAEIGCEVIDWTRKHTDASKLMAWIPFDCENVKLFAEKMGFVVEGISEDSIMKGGQYHSEWLMGLKLWQ